MREINLTPIPAAEYRPGHDTDEIKLWCRECAFGFDAEGEALSGLAELIDEWHRRRHSTPACSCWQQVNLHSGHCCFRDLPSDHEPGKRPPCGHWNPTEATP